MSAKNGNNTIATSVALCDDCHFKQRKETDTSSTLYYTCIDDDMPLDGLYIAHRERALKRWGASKPCPNCNRIIREGDFILNHSADLRSASVSRESHVGRGLRLKDADRNADDVGRYHPSKWLLAPALH